MGGRFCACFDGSRCWNAPVGCHDGALVAADGLLQDDWVGHFVALVENGCFFADLARVAYRNAAVDRSAFARPGCTGASLDLFQCLDVKPPLQESL